MKKIRLKSSFYKEPDRVCSLTICLKEGLKCFEHGAFSQDSVMILNDLSEDEKLRSLAYCFMPDHVHLLVMTMKGCDIVLFVQKFKSLISKLAKRHFNETKVWQRRFYDHFLRKEESINKVVEYI